MNHLPQIEDVVKFTGGKFNGFDGIVRKVCNDGTCSVDINYEKKLIEVVEHCGFFEFIASRAEVQSENKSTLFSRIREKFLGSPA